MDMADKTDVTWSIYGFLVLFHWSTKEKYSIAHLHVNAGYSIFVRVKSETHLGNFLFSGVIDYAALLSVLLHNKLWSTLK